MRREAAKSKGGRAGFGFAPSVRRSGRTILRNLGVAAAMLVMGALPAFAERATVLAQIDLPHNYYFREMYLPQLTTGPSAVAFSPDGKELVFSMAGSLWRQKIGSTSATEITHGGGYDYQPDWSSDGRRVAFARYDRDAVELWQLDLWTGHETQLTRGGAVNLEPRYAPDGKRLAYVSTGGSGHFNLFVADVNGDRLGAPRQLVASRQSAIARYYYSAWDHALSPAWTPDGKQIVFIGNREVAYGTGGLWKIDVDKPGEPVLILGEETAWRAKPQVASDGRRVLFASYHGRQWHQLWMTTLDGAQPLPLTFGEFDRTDARISPDGTRMAYISNADGNTSLWLRDLVGGAAEPVVAEDRHYKLPMGKLTISVGEAHGPQPYQLEPVSARISVIGADGRAYAPASRWMHADDGFDRSAQKFENHYFHCPGTCTLIVPRGNARISVTRGLDYAIVESMVDVLATPTTASVALRSIALPERYGAWTSADLHVHMNYGGHYRNTLDSLADQMHAEHLDVIHQLVVNKEERVPDIAGFSTHPYRDAGALIVQGQEFHTSYWGHLGILAPDDHLLEPGFAAYAFSALASPYPYNGVIADLAHQQHALVGYVHPFDERVDPENPAPLTNALPADVAHGKVDYYEVVGFSDHKASAEVWYRLLNLGFRLPTGAGTDAMANYASLRGPVGMNRVFVNVAPSPSPAAHLLALKDGHTFATNSALLGFEVDDRRPGDTIELNAPEGLSYHASLRSIVPMDHFEIVHNGRVVAALKLDGTRTSADIEGTIVPDASGWVVLRAWNDHADPHVQDIYPYATTSPVYLMIGGAAPKSPVDAKFFVCWLERTLESAAARTDYNSEHEKTDTLEYLKAARRKYEAMQ
jgi:dipeptidyl aminopeptidase/acylaminoacyl peptidase